MDLFVFRIERDHGSWFTVYFGALTLADDGLALNRLGRKGCGLQAYRFIRICESRSNFTTTNIMCV